MNKGKKEKLKEIRVRLTESLFSILQAKVQESGLSLNGYINFVLTSESLTEERSFQEVIGKPDKKEVESRVYFTISEADMLKEYAISNGWSLSKEISYRVISSLTKKPKLSGEELKAIYSVRSSINVLGANINRLIRNHEILSDDNVKMCCELTLLIKELQGKINYLEKCNYSRFKLKGVGGRDGR